MNRKTVATTALVGIIGFVFITGALWHHSQDSRMDSAELNSFDSEQEFISYLEDSQDTASQPRGSEGGATDQLAEHDSMQISEGNTAVSSDYAAPSENDVVEPERVKTDGENLFYSTRYPEHLHVIDNIPELDLKHNESNISGELVLNEENFLVVGRDRLKMLNKETLDEEWNKEYDSRLETVRKTGKELIVVMRTDIDTDNPCPVRPMADVAIPCSSIYYPGHNSQADYTYNIVKLDFETGEVLEEKAFTATSRTRVQVTPENTYIAYTESTPETELMKEFLLEHSSVSSDVKDRIREIDGYELTQSSERTEIGHAVESWIDGNEGREEQLESEVEQFEQENMDRFQQTHLIEFSNEDLEQRQQHTLTGATRNIESRDRGLVLSTRINGLNTYNLRSKIYTLENSRVEEVFDTEDRIGNFEVTKEAVLFESGDQLHRVDNSGERETMDAENLRFGSSASNYMVANEFDREKETGKIHLIDLSEFEIASTWEEDDPRGIYGFRDMKYQEDQSRLLFAGRNTTAIELDELSLQELEYSSDRILFVDDHILLVNRNEVRSLDSDLNSVSSIELARDRERPVVIREPAIER